MPSVVLDLLTWKELEQQVCGEADVPIETLKRTGEGVDDSLILFVAALATDTRGCSFFSRHA